MVQVLPKINLLFYSVFYYLPLYVLKFLTELYLSGAISYSGIISGLLTGAGVGTLVLFRYNDSRKKSAFIIGGLYLIGVIVGFIIQGLELLF